MYPRTLELSDTKLTLVQLEHAAGGTMAVHLKGFSFHSSLAVDHVDIEQRDGKLLVLIRLVPVRKGKDGNFDIRIELTRSDDVVLFGERAQQVWPK